jgi:hypothetical protein
VITVVAVFTTSCHVSEYLKNGPANSHNRINKTFAINIQDEPSAFAAAIENLRNMLTLPLLENFTAKTA